MVTSDGIQLPNEESMKTVDKEGYKYLDMLEIDQIKKEHLRKTKKNLKSKLNRKNIVLAWVVSLI